MIDLYDLRKVELARQCVAWGFAASHASIVWQSLYLGINRWQELPAGLQQRLISETRTTSLVPVRVADSADGLARKWLLQLHDGAQIETVLMQYRGRATVCVSSQVGCALGCTFCATGQLGYTRNLTSGEIIAQVLFANTQLQACGSHERLRNVVLMGMGEPLQNYDAVMSALDILRDTSGLAVGHKRITISTAGLVPGIIRLADENRPYSLAVSLHAADQEVRAAIMPIAQAWPLDTLWQACRYYTQKRQRKIFFEWTLIAGVNDSPAQASQLADWLAEMPAQVNLIPLNTTAGYAGEAATNAAAEAFRRALQSHGVACTVRQRRGIDIDAGCGQLAAMR